MGNKKAGAAAGLLAAAGRRSALCSAVEPDIQTSRHPVPPFGLGRLRLSPAETYGSGRDVQPRLAAETKSSGEYSAAWANLASAVPPRLIITGDRRAREPSTPQVQK